MIKKTKIRDLLNFLFLDHAILRPLWPNLEEVEGNIWRSSQPTYRNLKKLKEKGIKHVLRLRDNTDSINFKFEQEACRELNLSLTMIPLKARNTVNADNFIKLLDFFDKTEEPFVMHCKSGADRTGLAAAFYLIYKCGAPVDLAKKQLSPKYLHFKWTKSGILDLILDQYDEYIEINSEKNLRYWVENEYDPVKIKVAYNKMRISN